MIDKEHLEGVVDWDLLENKEYFEDYKEVADMEQDLVEDKEQVVVVD